MVTQLSMNLPGYAATGVPQTGAAVSPYGVAGASIQQPGLYGASNYGLSSLSPTGVGSTPSGLYSGTGLDPSLSAGYGSSLGTSGYGTSGLGTSGYGTSLGTSGYGTSGLGTSGYIGAGATTPQYQTSGGSSDPQALQSAIQYLEQQLSQMGNAGGGPSQMDIQFSGQAPPPPPGGGGGGSFGIDPSQLSAIYALLGGSGGGSSQCAPSSGYNGGPSMTAIMCQIPGQNGGGQCPPPPPPQCNGNQGGDIQALKGKLAHLLHRLENLLQKLQQQGGGCNNNGQTQPPCNNDYDGNASNCSNNSQSCPPPPPPPPNNINCQIKFHQPNWNWNNNSNSNCPSSSNNNCNNGNGNGSSLDILLLKAKLHLNN